MGMRQPDAKKFGRAKVMIGFAESIARRFGGGRVRKTILGLVIVASVFLAGCPVSDLHPLNNSGDNVLEPLLIGKWLPPDSNDKGFIAFEKASGSGYTMTINDSATGLTDRYDVQLVSLGGKLFADLHFSNRTHASTNVDMPIGLIATHMVVKLTIVKDDLGWATMDDDSLKNILKSDAASGKPTFGKMEYDSDNSLVLADTETLRRYVTAHGTDGFSEGDHWRREK
jgi:hypothetical protein